METRQLTRDETLPIDLLLLADENIEAIDRYVNNSQIYILERENKIIGVYLLYIISTETVEIKNIAVDKKFQRKGIGNFLLVDAETRASAMGSKRIIVGTADASIQLLYFYQKAGFEMFDIKPDFFITNYKERIFENGIRLKHMIMLKKDLK